MTPSVAGLDIPIIKESLSQENMAPRTKTTLSSVIPKVVTPAAIVIKSNVPAIDPPAKPIHFSSLPMLTKDTL